MVNYLVVFSKQAVKDKKHLKESGLESKAKELLKLLSEDPFKPPPAHEKLVGDLSGLYSRKINIQHRLVYEFISDPQSFGKNTYNGAVHVLRMWTHYE